MRRDAGVIGAAAAESGGRIAGLDLWRALLMMGGVFLHASSWLPPTLTFTLIGLASQSFRTGVFFAISGFLAGVSMAGRAPRRWLERRLLQVGLPTLFGLAVICPTMRFVVAARPDAAGGADPLPFDWYHLWFLIALLGYSAVGAALETLDRRLGFIARFGAVYCRGDASLLPLLLATGASAMTLMVVAETATQTLAGLGYDVMLGHVRTMVGYLPLYLLGLVFARACGMRETVMARWRSAALVVAAVTLGYAVWFGGARAWVDTDLAARLDVVALMLGACFCPPAAFVLVFRSAIAIRRVPRPLARLADASLTVYLVHLPIIVAINLAMAGSGWSPYLRYAIAVIGGGGLSYAIHVALVKRSRWLGILVNGRIGAPPPRLSALTPA